MQEAGYRRTIEELVTLYEVEPDVRDIFVEGRSDRNFLSEYLSDEVGATLCSVYDVSDRVEVPDGELLKAGLLVGKRGRIIWLAQELAQRIPGHESALLVADKDFASLGADPKDEIHGLLYTDFSSMEAYALNDRTLSKFLRVAIGAPDYVTPTSLISAIKPALICLFVIRLCLRDSGTQAVIPAKVLSKWDLDDNSEAKVREVFRLSLDKVPRDERNGKTPDFLLAEYVACRDKVVGEFRDYINGHDVSVAIVRFLKSECAHVFNADARRPLQTPEVLELVMMSCIEKGHLEAAPMFQALRRWACS
ncbi:hypothetical protein [Streptomyces sp. VNUA74]|uniref:hypothetical protein n=1 Tax=Streptomyces sp. VNUA74 TaxID=3062685 RepID=UPI00280B6160|nr:hypothetical protein [Streptomyces sp. VNUA74]WML82555.1 hypothetical protein Q3101_23070 [Streptomyces sp. VNUA74]